MLFVRGVGMAVLLLGASGSYAADPGFYFGLTVGQAKYDNGLVLTYGDITPVQTALL